MDDFIYIIFRLNVVHVIQKNMYVEPKQYVTISNCSELIEHVARIYIYIYIYIYQLFSQKL